MHKKVKETEYYFLHVSWLQERFPESKYEDVTGLCKLVSMDEIKEQEYSLNPGRYVGVVIEEDGKTEEEFIQEMLSMNDELNKLNLEDAVKSSVRSDMFTDKSFCHNQAPSKRHVVSVFHMPLHRG